MFGFIFNGESFIRNLVFQYVPFILKVRQNEEDKAETDSITLWLMGKQFNVFRILFLFSLKID